MNVLLTNDDGFDAEGLQTLRAVFEKSHTVWVMAPVKNHSGSSCSLTIKNQLEFFKKAKNQYALDGTPVDCVLNAVDSKIFPHKIDVVISGINSDSNLGSDVLYSGTCGAARQASAFGIPGIALSVKKDASHTVKQEYEGLAQFALKNLKTLISLCGEKKHETKGGHYEYFVNVNAPVCGPYKDVRLCTLSKRVYSDTVRIVKESDGKQFFYALPSGEGVRSYGDGTEDTAVVADGMIAVSAVYTEPQCSFGGGTCRDIIL